MSLLPWPLHPALDSAGSNFAALSLAVPVDRVNVNPSTTAIVFGTTANYLYCPRGFEVIVGGAVSFSTGEGAVLTRTFTAGTIVRGIITELATSGSTSTSIDLLY